MTTLLAPIPPVDCNSLAPVPAPCPDSDVPADVEPVAPYSDADARWLAENNTGGCHPDDLSPEDRLIAMSMTAMEWRLEQMADASEASDRYSAGYSFF